MKRILNTRPAPSMIVALVALFVAMGGVGYAAATIGSAQVVNNSLRSKDIRNNDVRGKDIRAGTVRSSDVKDDDLQGKDILESSLGTVPSAQTAKKADKADTAATAGNAYNVGGRPANSLQGKLRWVQVEGDDGTIRAQSGGISVTRNSEGNYRVDFGSSTVNGTLIASGAATFDASNGFVNAQRCGGPPLGLFCGDGGDNLVVVSTDNPDSPGLNDMDFYLTLAQ